MGWESSIPSSVVERLLQRGFTEQQIVSDVRLLASDKEAAKKELLQRGFSPAKQTLFESEFWPECGGVGGEIFVLSKPGVFGLTRFRSGQSVHFWGEKGDLISFETVATPGIVWQVAQWAGITPAALAARRTITYITAKQGGELEISRNYTLPAIYHDSLTMPGS